MNNSRSAGAIVIAIVLLAIGPILGGPGVLASNSAAEEFVGPFASWRQVQCTGGDDTALLQTA